MITLFNHQISTLELSKDKYSFAWFLETGTGKTIIALENIKYLYEHKKIDAAIIAAPKTVLKPVWSQMLIDFYSELDYYIFSWIGNISDYQLNVFSSLVKSKTATSKLLIFLVNIEAFSFNKIYSLVSQIIQKWNVIWIIDESTTIKSHTAKRTKGILKIQHLVNYKRILSGYPVLKSPEDLYTQIQFLGNDLIPYRSFYAFRNHFCYLKQLDSRVTISIGPRNVPELGNIIKPFSIRILKNQCLDLPDKIRTIRYIEMLPEQKQYYRQMKEEGYITIKNSNEQSFASTLLVQLEKLHQIANGIIISLNKQIPCNKYSIMTDIIKNEIGDSQCIIWSSYVNNILAIDKTLEQTHRMIYGDVPISERTKIITEFNLNKFQILVINPATGMFGINLANASYAIYFNNSFKLEHRIQSEDRLHRIGQKNNVTYIDLITEDTIEIKILKALERKHNIGAEVLKDEWEEWFK